AIDCGDCSEDTRCGDSVCAPGETDDTCSIDCPDEVGCTPEIGLPQCPANPTCTGSIDPTAGKVCGGIKEAWTSSADNVGYYPFKVLDRFKSVRVVTRFGNGPGDTEVLLGTLTAGDTFAV